MLSPDRRLAAVLELIEEHRFFTLHAGRQTGKTTSARWLVEHLNAGDRLRAVWVDVQVAREQPDPARAFEALRYCLDTAVARDLPELGPPADDRGAAAPASTFVLRYLRDLAARCPRPLVVLLDGVDGLVGEAMASLLTQLRQGYLDRSRTPFPASVVLVGLQPVRDHVSAEVATLGAFTEAEIAELLGQHAAATGQRFEPEAARRIWELGQGHPWLTNALADQIVRRDVDAKDRGVAIGAAHVDAAREAIIRERRTHVDSLIARLHEPRVRRILAPMLAGARPTDLVDDDVSYLLGLGLVRMEQGELRIANPVYREVIPCALTWTQQISIHQPTAWYVRPDGSLDMDGLLAGFQTFWRRDGHLAAEGFDYREAGPHLMLMAFLQRVIDGGGRVEREYGLGRGALDLVVSWHDERFAIEVKLRRDTETDEDALEQVARHLGHAGWLVLFDLRKERAWQDKLFVREVSRGGRTIRVVGC
jgi:hypothetical protein